MCIDRGCDGKVEFKLGSVCVLCECALLHFRVS